MKKQKEKLTLYTSLTLLDPNINVLKFENGTITLPEGSVEKGDEDRGAHLFPIYGDLDEIMDKLMTNVVNIYANYINSKVTDISGNHASSVEASIAKVLRERYKFNYDK